MTKRFNEDDVRLAFLQVMLALFGSYRWFLKPEVNPDPMSSELPFETKQFIAHQPEDFRPFVTQVSQTQVIRVSVLSVC